MNYEICSIYEEYYPYFTVPQEGEYYKLEEVGQAADALYEEGARPFNVIDLELTEFQKGQFNSLKVEINKRLTLDLNKHELIDNTVYSFIRDCMKQLSSSNDPEVVNELSNLIYNISEKVIHNFFDKYNMVTVDLRPAHSYVDNFGQYYWHTDSPAFKSHYLYFLTTLLGLPTVYFVPSPETYSELGDGCVEHSGKKYSTDGVKCMIELLGKFSNSHHSDFVNKFSAPQGYATLHSGSTIHSVPVGSVANQDRLILLIRAVGAIKP